MATEARLRISLATGEFEVEGPTAFIAQYDEVARELLTRLQAYTPGTSKPEGSSNADAVAGQGNGSSGKAEALSEFGEAIHKLPKNASGTDMILVAGYYAAMSHSDQTFATAEASKLLVEQSIKIANPSQSMKNNLTAKKVFKVGSRYKLSRDGIDRVKQLL